MFFIVKGEIADIIGYQADEYFQKVFKKENDLTQSKYRKEVKEFTA